MSLWENRRESQNPAYPYEWALEYGNGEIFPRLKDGAARLTAQAPRAGITALHVSLAGRPVATIRPLSQLPDQVVVRALVIQSAEDMRRERGEIGGWRFGFQHGDRFVGVVIDQTGRIRHTPTNAPLP